jgi:hypothetical protein
MAHPGGRPLKFQSIDELQEKIDAYFYSCDPHVEEVTEWVEARDSSGNLRKDKNGLNFLVEVTHKVKTQQIDYTISDLALALDTTRRTLLDYEKRDDEFSHTIKKAKQRVEAYWERKLANPSPTGTIFNLKNNFQDWKDKSESEITNPDGSLNPMNALTAEELRKLAGK